MRATLHKTPSTKRLTKRPCGRTGMVHRIMNQHPWPSRGDKMIPQHTDHGPMPLAPALTSHPQRPSPSTRPPAAQLPSLSCRTHQ
jgi:hypothetical protein